MQGLDQLFSGQKYEDVKPVTHIGVIDFDLDRVPGKKERKPGRLLRQIRLLDCETHEVYNDKLELRIVSLRELGNASDEDRKLEEYARYQRTVKREMAEQAKMLKEQAKELEEQASELENYARYKKTVSREMEEKDRKLEEKDRLIEELMARLQQR